MAKIILAINAGSSSVKVSVYKAHPDEKIASHKLELKAVAQISGLTAPPAKLKYVKLGSTSKEKIKDQEVKNVSTQEDAFEYILNHLIEDHGLPELHSKESFSCTCHRVVHGGDYPSAHIIDQETIHHLEELTDLAPLHNASALAIVKTCIQSLPKARNIAFFDSAFHASIPEAVRTYPIDPQVAQKNKLRKYGFHGLSYAFITNVVAGHLGKPHSQVNLIALHLGSGASACAIRNGKSLDNSMGLTPLDGLPGATRSGSVDPSLIFHFTHDAGRPSPSSTKEMHISTAEEILNKKSGWKALTGTTDFGDISSSKDPKCELAFEIVVDRICGFVGSYYVKLEGNVDALVFAGGIGEKGAKLRATVVEKCRCLGFEIDERKNEAEKGDGKDEVTSIGKEDARHDVLVVQTNEEYQMASGCLEDPSLFNVESG